MVGVVLKARVALWSMIISLVFLACSDKTPTASAPSGPPDYDGVHDITTCNGIMGWALDRNRPNDPIRVEIYDGDTLLATVTAGDFRQDLLDAGKGNGKHGFTYPVPPRLRDGQTHLIRMKYAGTNTDLSHTPKEINCTFAQ